MWGQCSDTLHNKAEEVKRFIQVNLDSNPIDLLKIIRACAYKFEHSKYIFQAVVEAMDTFNQLKQYKKEDNNKYFKR